MSERPSWAVMGRSGPPTIPPVERGSFNDLHPDWVCSTCAAVRPPHEPCHDQNDERTAA